MNRKFVMALIVALSMFILALAVGCEKEENQKVTIEDL